MEDTFGDMLKFTEQLEAGRKADRTKPLMCRLDGRAFHTLTRGLARPYDERFSQLMVDTAKFLIEETHAKLAYTQSDEITLHWNLDPQVPSSQFLFDGKFQKMTSVIASLASAFFTKELALRIPEKAGKIEIFDARIWNVENQNEVFHNYLWRQDDAIKNSISMAAQAHFSSKELLGVGSEQKKQWLKSIGHAWEDEPPFFKMGTFLRRETLEMELTEEELSKIPEQFQPKCPVKRSRVVALPIEYIGDSVFKKEFLKSYV